MDIDNTRIAVIGLGYVGLPLAVEFAKKYPVVGYDISTPRIQELRQGKDSSLEVEPEELAKVSMTYTDALDDIRDCNVYIVTVPTPIDEYKSPDLRPLISASRAVGQIIGRGDVVVYESTVYPGATEEDCIPVIEEVSGLRFNQDFFAGYSPERINPGDKEHRVTTIKKVTSGSTPEVADFVDALYGSIIVAGTHKATSIKVAEAAKVIENTQRDVNIALINELSLIFAKLGIDTEEVLKAAGTKWNFLPFRPGLVGGHCIGVDPYYLIHKAQEAGHFPELIMAARRINDGMATYVGDRFLRLLAKRRVNVVGARVLVLGLTFKENCPDLRNSQVAHLVERLRRYHAEVDALDPWVDADEAAEHVVVPLADRATEDRDGVERCQHDVGDPVHPGPQHQGQVDHQRRDDDVERREEEERLTDVEREDPPGLHVRPHVGSVQGEQVDIGEDQHRGGPQRCDLQACVDRMVGTGVSVGHRWGIPHRRGARQDGHRSAQRTTPPVLMQRCVAFSTLPVPPQNNFRSHFQLQCGSLWLGLPARQLATSCCRQRRRCSWTRAWEQ